MTKRYDLHSVRIEDEIWERVRASGTSVNQLLRKALDLPWVKTRHVVVDERYPSLKSGVEGGKKRSRFDV